VAVINVAGQYISFMLGMACSGLRDLAASRGFG
jgi:hypothetical protein